MTAEQMIFIGKVAKKWAKRSQSDWRELYADLMEEAELAEWCGKDPCDAVKWAWKYWEFGKSEHRRSKHEKPTHLEPREWEGSSNSPENEIIDRDLLRRIWNGVGDKARAAMKANYAGAPYVWRPEVKCELRAVADDLLYCVPA